MVMIQIQVGKNFIDDVLIVALLGDAAQVH